jgi:hypothetical protein
MDVEGAAKDSKILVPTDGWAQANHLISVGRDGLVEQLVLMRRP